MYVCVYVGMYNILYVCICVYVYRARKYCRCNIIISNLLITINWIVTWHGHKTEIIYRFPERQTIYNLSHYTYDVTTRSGRAGLIHNKSHPISPGYPRSSIALQVQNRGLKHQSIQFICYTTAECKQRWRNCETKELWRSYERNGGTRWAHVGKHPDIPQTTTIRRWTIDIHLYFTYLCLNFQAQVFERERNTYTVRLRDGTKHIPFS